MVSTAASPSWVLSKETGNGHFQKGDFKEATTSYSAGIDAMEAAADSAPDPAAPDASSPDPSVAATGEPRHVTLGKLYLNRAMCHFKLSFWEDCVQDCSACLKNIHNYPKALYRRSLAHKELGRLSAALQDAMTFTKYEEKPGKLGPPLVRDVKLAVENWRKKQIETSTGLPTKAIAYFTTAAESFELRSSTTAKASDGDAATDAPSSVSDQASSSSADPANFAKQYLVSDAAAHMDNLARAVYRNSKKSLLDAVPLVCRVVKQLLSVHSKGELTLKGTGATLKAEEVSTKAEDEDMPKIEEVDEDEEETLLPKEDVTKEKDGGSSSDDSSKLIEEDSPLMRLLKLRLEQAGGKQQALLTEKELDFYRRLLSVSFEFLSGMGNYIQKDADEPPPLKDQKLPTDEESDKSQALIREHLPVRELRSLLFRKLKTLDVVSTSTATTTRFDFSHILDAQSVLEAGVGVLFFYSPNTDRTRHGLRGKLENPEVLACLADACDLLSNYDSTEAVRVFTKIADERRRMGQNAKAYVPNQQFYRLVEATLKSTPACNKILRACLAQVWNLLADSERPAADSLDLEDVAQRIILPFVGEPEESKLDHATMANGFLSLSTMFYVNQKAGTACLLRHPQVLQNVMKVAYHTYSVQDSDTRLLQVWASDTLVQAMRDSATRTAVLKGGGLDLVMNLLQKMSSWDTAKIGTVQGDQTRMLKAKLVCILALLAAHDEDTCTQIFELTDFMGALTTAFGYIKDYSEIVGKARKDIELKAKRRADAGGAPPGGGASSGPSSSSDPRGGSATTTSGAAEKNASSSSKQQLSNPFSEVPSDARLLNLSNQDCVESALLQSLDFDNLLKMKKAFLEAFVYLSMHAYFKEEFYADTELMREFFTTLITPEDISADGNTGFYFSNIVFNFVRSRDDKVRPRKREYPYTELDDDQMDALEQFYERMPDESKPAQQGGKVDAGSPELAMKYRTFLVETDGCLEKLAECARTSSVSSKISLAFIYNFLTKSEVSWRRELMKAGAVGVLLRLEKELVELDAEKQNLKSVDAARQALAHLAISTNPQLFTYSDAADMIRPLVELAKHAQYELYNYEGALALTNLAAETGARDVLIQMDGWDVGLDLCFETNEMVQRAGLELMCNLAHDERTVERVAARCRRYLEGKGGIKDQSAPAEIKLMLCFCADTTRDVAEIERAEREDERARKDKAEYPDSDEEVDWADKKPPKQAFAKPAPEQKDPLVDNDPVLRKLLKKDKSAKPGPSDEQLGKNDLAFIIAASGALAVLTQDDDICKMCSLCEQFHYLVGLAGNDAANPDAELRAVTAVCNIVASDAVLGKVKYIAQGALAKKEQAAKWRNPRSAEVYQNLIKWMKEEGKEYS